MTRRGSRFAALLAAALVTGMLCLWAPAAQASVTCTEGSPNWRIHNKYTDTFGRTVPLRCGYWNGVKGWGVMKLKAKGRWNVWYRDMIGATLEAPSKHWAQNATTDIYVTGWQTNCKPQYRFRVVVNHTHQGRKYMMGVVNAYKETR